jgi:hypothetical protein
MLLRTTLVVLSPVDICLLSSPRLSLDGFLLRLSVKDVVLRPVLCLS